MISSKSIDQLVEETAGASSFNRYGSKKWQRQAKWLRMHGLSDDAIVLILRSDVMRWAADAFGTDTPSRDAVLKYAVQWPEAWAKTKMSIEAGEFN